ncbi:HAD hydrolase-like protein [bacterium]|nr:HAD hydrolase-like protein [bacterium]
MFRPGDLVTLRAADSEPVNGDKHMIHPDLYGARTLIFDMDGTVIRSGKMAIHALRKGLKIFYGEMKRPLPDYDDHTLVRGLGVPSNDFYRDLLTEDVKQHWERFRELVHNGEDEYLQSHRVTFPGAVKTLSELKRRGYKLALISNCNRDYIDAVTVSQKLVRQFDMIGCIGDYEGATKASLFDNVIRQLGGPAVAIGDRHYDVDAAKANSIPAVGALYGYGGREELLETATWVEDIRDLTYLFDPLKELAEECAYRINDARQNDRAALVAVDAPHPVLTERFVPVLLTALTSLNIPATQLPLERHHKPLSEELPPDQWVRNAYPWDRLKTEIVEPVQRGERIDIAWHTADGERVFYRTRPGSVLVVHGTGLSQSDLRDRWIQRFWVDADNAAVSQAVRTSHGTGSKEMETWKRFGKRYLRWYVEKIQPAEGADRVLPGETLLHGGGEIGRGTG